MNRILWLVAACVSLEAAPALSAHKLNLRGTLNDEHQEYVRYLAFSPDGKSLVSATDGRINLWDVTTRKRIAKLWMMGDGPAAFTPDGKTLAWVSGACSMTLRLWDVAAAKETGRFNLGLGMGSWRFTPNGKSVAWMDDETIQVYDVATRKKIVSLEEPSHWRTLMAASSNGQTLAIKDKDEKTIVLRDLATQKATTTLRGHIARVWGVAFSPDGRTFASASEDRTIKLWDVRSGKNTTTVEGHSGWVLCVSFSPDGTTLASGSNDETIKLWDVTTTKNIATTKRHTGIVICLAFSPDGKTLASGTYESRPGEIAGGIRLWDVKPVKEGGKR